MVTQELIRSLLDYNPETGIFTWKHSPREMFSSDVVFRRWNTKMAGKAAGTLNNSASKTYLKAKIGDYRVLLHRAAWVFVYGVQPLGVIDHINGNTLDNRISNLRDTTQSSNCKNRKRNTNNNSGVNGVCWSKSSGAWHVRAGVHYKNLYLGRFEQFFDAICARKSFDAKSGFNTMHGQNRDHSES